MEHATNVDDLFADDDDAAPAAPEAAPEPPKKKPRQQSKPKPDTKKPKADAEPIDNAVRIRKLDWECVCGNTNTHDLQRCGKCKELRYS